MGQLVMRKFIDIKTGVLDMQVLAAIIFLLITSVASAETEVNVKLDNKEIGLLLSRVLGVKQNEIQRDITTELFDSNELSNLKRFHELYFKIKGDPEEEKSLANMKLYLLLLYIITEDAHAHLSEDLSSSFHIVFKHNPNKLFSSVSAMPFSLDSACYWLATTYIHPKEGESDMSVKDYFLNEYTIGLYKLEKKERKKCLSYFDEYRY